jgi:hypothetical protein
MTRKVLRRTLRLAPSEKKNFRMPDPRSTKTEIGRAYWSFHQRTHAAVRPSFLPWVDADILEAFESRATIDPGGRVAAIHRDLMGQLANAPLAADETARDAFRALYMEAELLVFPATTGYLQHQHGLLDFTRNHSLASVDLEMLRKIDQIGHGDTDFDHYVRLLVARLGPGTASPDVVAYSQFFEIYGEALALQFLRGRPGLRVARVPEESDLTPDFRCMLDDVPEFYIEVKSLDIVDGEFRHDEMMREGIDTTVELARQKADGRPVSTAAGIVAPYPKLGGAGYDPRSLINVIDTIRAKFRRAFRPAQFTRGPTFALAVMDRLIIPHGRNDLAPFYYQPFQSGACISGVLWHAAYGTIGSPIFRITDLEGEPTLEGRLTSDGLYVDIHQVFPGLGTIVLAKPQRQREAWGIQARDANLGGWGSGQAKAVLQTVCDAMNDEDNSFAYRLSHPDYPEGAPARQ